MEQRLSGGKAALSAAKAAPAKVGPSLALERYAGTYRDPWYGDVAVTGTADGLRIDFKSTPRMAGKLVHWQYDTFVTRFDDKAIEPAYVTFALDADGKVIARLDEGGEPDRRFQLRLSRPRSAPGGQANEDCSPSPPFSSPAAPPRRAGPPRKSHRDFLVLDTHLDTPLHFARPGWSFAGHHDPATDLVQVDLERMDSGALDGGFFAIYTEQGPLTAKGYADALAFARKRSDLIDTTLSAFPNRDRIS